MEWFIEETSSFLVVDIYQCHGDIPWQNPGICISSSIIGFNFQESSLLLFTFALWDEFSDLCINQKVTFALTWLANLSCVRVTELDFLGRVQRVTCIDLTLMKAL